MSGTSQGGPLKPSTPWSSGASGIWGPYWDAPFPPRPVTPWINFKRGSTGVNVARRFWDEREYLRNTYEAVYGSDPAVWPSQHPGVLLDAVFWIAHPACLRCHWFHAAGYSMKNPDDLKRALVLARRHETSDGAFRGDNRSHRGTPQKHIEEIFAEQEQKNAELRARVSAEHIPPLRIAPRYARGPKSRIGWPTR